MIRFFSWHLNRVISSTHFCTPLYPPNPPVMQVLPKFVVGEEFVVVAPVVEYTCGMGRVVFEGVSKLADDIPRCQECSFAVDGSSYINISNSGIRHNMGIYPRVIGTRHFGKRAYPDPRVFSPAGIIGRYPGKMHCLPG